MSSTRRTTVPLDDFTNFGSLLLYLRRRAQLRQRDLASAVGYSEAQIGRLEHNHRLPDSMVVRALFVPALAIDDPELAARLIELAEQAHLDAQPTSSFRQAPTDAAPKQHLPLPVAPLLGRDAELAKLSGLLTDSATRCVTIVGLGGVGKTRLALEAISVNAAGFGDGAHAVMLAGVASSDLLLPTIVQAFALPLTGNDAWQLLVAYLRERKVLLLIDNLEHLITPVARLLAELLAAAPRLTLLTTSRERLNIQDEVLFSLTGLALPQGTNAHELATSSATQLFVAQACREHQAFAPNAQDLLAIAEICHTVEGLPLGIELAAAWTSVLPCPQIAAELRRGLSSLQSTSRDVSQRQHSIRAVFDYSWSLLTAVEQQALARLSVFCGGFERTAAAAVLAELVSGPWAEALLLRALVDKSMLQRSGPAEAARFDLHLIVRQFAAERLGIDTAAQAAARARHAQHYLALLVGLEERLKSHDQPQAKAIVDGEFDNIRAAWHYASETYDYSALCAAGPLLLFYFELRYWYQEALTTFQQLADSLEHKNTPAAQSALATALCGAGAFAFFCGQKEDGVAKLTRAVALQRVLGEQRPLGEMLFYLGALLGITGRTAEGQRALQESMRLYEAVGDAWGVTRSLYRLGIVLAAHGKCISAHHVLAECLLRVRRIGDRRGVIMTLIRLGDVLLLLGRYDEARQVLQEAQVRSSAAGDMRGSGASLAQLGLVALVEGELAVARYLLQESLILFDDIGDHWYHTRTLSLLGHLALAEGDLAEAGRAFAAVVVAAREQRLTPLLLDGLAGRAALLLHEGDTSQAVEILALVQQHVSSEQLTRDRAARLLRHAAEQLTPAMLAVARARGRVATPDDYLADS